MASSVTKSYAATCVCLSAPSSTETVQVIPHPAVDDESKTLDSLRSSGLTHARMIAGDDGRHVSAEENFPIGQKESKVARRSKRIADAMVTRSILNSPNAMAARAKANNPSKKARKKIDAPVETIHFMGSHHATHVSEDVPALSLDYRKEFARRRYLLHSKGHEGGYHSEMKQMHRVKEEEFLVDHRYLAKLSSVGPRLRADCISWMKSISSGMDLVPETLFIAISIFDRYLSQRSDHSLHSRDLPVIAVCVLFLAAKYEEISPPTLEDILVYGKDKCKKYFASSVRYEEVVKMEEDILIGIKYELNVPTLSTFLRWYSKALAQSFAEIGLKACYQLARECIKDAGLLQFAPSLVAACIVLLTAKVQHKMGFLDSNWIRAVEDETNYKVADECVRTCAQYIASDLWGPGDERTEYFEPIVRDIYKSEA